MEYLAITLAVSGVMSACYIGANRLMLITEMLVQIREQGRINNVAIESLRIYDESINSRLTSVENYLEKMTDFRRR